MAVSQIAASASNADVPDNDYIAKHKPLPIRIGTHLRRYWQLWLMALPAMVFVFIFAYIPMYGIQLAFREFVPRKGLTGGTFVGLKYFNKFFQSPQFANLMRNTISISLWTLVMGFICPIILALLINQLGSKKIKGFVQTITYMPHFISTVVIVSMISIFLNPIRLHRPLPQRGRQEHPGRPESVHSDLLDHRSLAALRLEFHHLPGRTGRRRHRSV